jgi:Ser/Thr protein kinase RdoA (MazF antagonist)
LRAFHDAVEGFSLAGNGSSWSTELADPSGTGLVCHNDVCPENVVFRAGEAVALLDFDFAAPGRRVWDVAATLSMWAPLHAPQWRRGFPTSLDPVARVALFADAYGLGDRERAEFLPLLRRRQQMGRSFVRSRIRHGDQSFEQMVAEFGGEERWDAADRWLDAEAAQIEARLCGGRRR